MKTVSKAAALCLALTVSAGLGACSSLDRQRREGPSDAPLEGMIYDRENRPVAGAEVFLDGQLLARSDINGRFCLGEPRFGAHRVEVAKKGYEGASFALDYRDATQVVYAKLVSAAQLVAAARTAAQFRRWSESLALLDRAEALGEPDPAARYLRALVLFRRGDSEAAKDLLEAILADGFDEPYVHLFLADICQYRLEDARQAATHLERYLAERGDPDAEKRLEALKSGAPSP